MARSPNGGSQARNVRTWLGWPGVLAAAAAAVAIAAIRLLLREEPRACARRRPLAEPALMTIGPGMHQDAWGDGTADLDELLTFPTDEDDLLAPDPYHATLRYGPRPANRVA